MGCKDVNPYSKGQLSNFLSTSAWKSELTEEPRYTRACMLKRKVISSAYVDRAGRAPYKEIQNTTRVLHSGIWQDV